ncbi:hypothetical protein DITRI_Ditri07aG0043300 [Diplodiscus trichospermus]
MSFNPRLGLTLGKKDGSVVGSKLLVLYNGMMSISVKVAEARDFLSDDKELVNTYERLTALDGKRRFVLAAVASYKEEVGRLRFVSA